MRNTNCSPYICRRPRSNRWLSARQLLSSAASERTVYLRDDAGAGSYVPLVTAGNVPPETAFGGANSGERMSFVAGTPDLSHVLLYSPFALTGEATFESSYPTLQNQTNLYEWSAGRLQLVNILPEAEGGEPTRGPAPKVRLAGGTTGEGTPSEVNPSALSSDGRRVAWTLGVPGNGAGAEYKGLYVRDMVDGETVKVSGPNGVFQWMSSDGSKVFFLEGGDLHLCDIVEAAGGISCAYSDLTGDYAAGESSGGVQQLVSDVSRDGSYVFFVARGVLAGAPGAVSGGDTLYCAARWWWCVVDVVDRDAVARRRKLVVPGRSRACRTCRGSVRGFRPMGSIWRSCRVGR